MMNVKTKKLLINTAELVIFILTVVFVVSVYTESDHISDVTCEEVIQAVLSDAVPDGTVKASENEFRKRFDLSESDYDGFAYFKPESGMDVTELIIVKSESAAVRSRLTEELSTYLSERKEVFESYAPEQYALLMSAETVDKNGFVFFAVGGDAAVWYDSFCKAVRN
jgi:hypothetical protein